jgi:hypothetical protein
MKGCGVGRRKNAWLQHRLIHVIRHCGHMLRHGCNVLVQHLLIHCKLLHCQRELVGHCQRVSRCGMRISQRAAHRLWLSVSPWCCHPNLSPLPTSRMGSPWGHILVALMWIRGSLLPRVALEHTVDKCLKRRPRLVVCCLPILKLLH